MEDLMVVAAAWDKWFDKNATTKYRAYILTPMLGNFVDHPEVIWMGFSPTPSDLGRTMDEWMSKGREMQAQFNEVVSCSSHALQGVQVVRPYDRADEPSVVQVSSCERKPGVSWGQVAMADNLWAEWMEKNGITGGTQRWWSGPGSPRGRAADPDMTEAEFQQVWITGSMEERGKAVEAYRAADDAAGDVYSIFGDDSLYECDTARVWYAQPVGGSE